MKQCWEEKPQSRPSFSSLVVSVGNMLTDDYQKRYLQLTENFLKGENPAVVRSRMSSSRAAEDQTNILADMNGGPTPQENVYLLEVEPVEDGPSHGTYIIPITDITIETSNGAALDAVRYEH
ncbi:platelet-derived growth factor receptor beta-like [Sparus aurata]|uniref:platelet-derived growth factor receptor beta-like n=1 Tax=Sparus aurata TaxID=8175 RepID=UPI0011C11DA9|nr:platelet-derived growth factor receptor beta-like [Sparus aurata]